MSAELSPRQAITLALWVSLGSVVSLGITRFSYGLLLPPMRADLGWSYTLAGAMNTANALGYLLGALSSPWLLKRWGATGLLLKGVFWASIFMAACGAFTDAGILLSQRLLAGITSAWAFVSGGVIAARLGILRPERSGLLLGIYYGGTGWGIVLSALGVPWWLGMHAHDEQGHSWQGAWVMLAVWSAVCVLALWFQRHGLKRIDGHASVSAKTESQSELQRNGSGAFAPSSAQTSSLPLAQMWKALGGYTFFGVGYIGYMTFVVALLRQQGQTEATITGFYALLGLAVVASSRIWSGLLDKAKGGGALATLNALLGVAVALPVITHQAWALWVSGLMFGGVFLSLVASTTAFVRHNLPQPQWASGISAFTIVFALGQIVGPTMVGWIADGPGGLERGLAWSALALALAALMAWQQKPLSPVPVRS